jgi:hypothetical protein
MNYYFILPNDTFKSEYETSSFHRDMPYEVSHVFNDNGKLRVFIKDKYGKDVEYTDYRFKPTGKTVTAMEERQKRSRLDFYWNNPDTSFVINPSYHYNFETTEFFELSKAHFLGEGMKDVIASLSRHKKEHTDSGWKHHDVAGSKSYLKSKQDFYDYFKKIDIDTVRINGMHREPQDGIDHLQFMLSIPSFNESLLNLSDDLRQEPVDRTIHSIKPNIDEFLTIVARVIFDENQLSEANKKLVYNVIEAYELLPKSYGPTSVTKLLLGKEKKENKTVQHLSGTCTTLKQPQLFTLCDIVESFMYVHNIFVTKDEYSNSDEWRGSYEFIGSKMINSDELKTIKNKLNLTEEVK